MWSMRACTPMVSKIRGTTHTAMPHFCAILIAWSCLVAGPGERDDHALGTGRAIASSIVASLPR